MISEAYRFISKGDQYDLFLEQHELEAVKPHEVLIHVEAVSLNYRDLVHLQNKAGRSVAGKIPCSDGVGIVEAVGAEVKHIKQGHRVAGLFFQEWMTGSFEMKFHQQALGGSANGMLARHVILSADGVIEVPQHLSATESACLPCAGLTAYYSMFTRMQVQRDKTLLTLGTGGVSLFALQFAKAAGLQVIITSSDDHKLMKAKQLGADYTINYIQDPDWDKIVQQQTDKRGVDYVIEVGGPGTLGKSLNSLKPAGKVALIGVLTGFGAPQESLFPLVAKNAELHGIYVGPKDIFKQMNEFISNHNILPIIDRVFSFNEARVAFDYLASGKHFGKVVIEL